MAQPQKTSVLRLGTLSLALVGCVVVALPQVVPLTEPLPLVLLGCGVTVVALACFLFCSL